MSGALPNVGFEAINIQSEQKTLLSKTVSGKTFRRQIDGQRWTFTCSYPNIKRSDFAAVQAFIIKQRGSKEDFTITFPSYLNAQGSETGSVLVNGVHAVGDTTIAMDAFAGDGAGRFKAGDFIKFAHSKVYMVVSDVTSSSNAATVTIEPPLTTALSNNEAVTYDSVPFTVFLKNDVQEFPSNNIASDGSILFTYEIDVEESI
jgi:hypothetical protein|tara:strand:+ start:20881 stop:21489 length:609 start_codon:yes stop_codon:yes gene_type:complete